MEQLYEVNTLVYVTEQQLHHISHRTFLITKQTFYLN